MRPCSRWALAGGRWLMRGWESALSINENHSHLQGDIDRPAA
jgi:hypothetical protein